MGLQTEHSAQAVQQNARAPYRSPMYHNTCNAESKPRNNMYIARSEAYEEEYTSQFGGTQQKREVEQKHVSSSSIQCGRLQCHQ